MRYQMAESTKILANFPTGHTVTVDIYELIGITKIVSAAAMTEIGSTGWYYYAFAPAPAVRTEYLFSASDGYDQRGGKIVLGGYPDTLATSQAAEEADISTIEGNISTIEGNISTIAGDVASIEASQSGEESDIGTIQAYMSTLLGAITGAGLTEKTYTLTDASTGLPLVGVQVWATTDESGLNQVDITRTTNDAGQVTFRFNLTAGTPIYIWNRYMAEGDAPDEEEV